MNTPTGIWRICLVAAALLAAAPGALAQNIYKCTQDGHVSYTDHPCPGNRGELLHQADDTEIIDQYLRLGQDRQAQQYAQARQLEALYAERVRLHEQVLQERAQRQADDAFAAQQREEQAHQQALADAAAQQQDGLQTENDALRAQNAQYQSQLQQPIYDQTPAYWNAAPPYRERRRHGHDRPQRQAPVFHPCKQLAGGRVQC